MALTIKTLCGYVAAGSVLLLVGNMVFISISVPGSLSETMSRGDIRKKIELLNAESKLQAEKEERLQQDLAKIEKTWNEKKVEKRKEKKEDNARPEVVIPNDPKPDSQPEQRDADGATYPSEIGVDEASGDVVMPILMFACDRASSVTTALDDLIRYRPSKEKFPIIVSQDCGHQETSDAIDKYASQIHAHIKQPDLSEIRDLPKKVKKNLIGYYKIARHYKWALGQVFDEMKYEVAIIMEDDLNISPDFYEYFEGLYPILKSDSSLYCVSAWNDNGKAKHIEDNPELLHRSDFFPGLGWMLRKSLWDELRDKWPKGFWDDWIRQEEQRKGRACIRPEISRTHTFGEKGVSLGEFWKQHLRFIVLNDKKVEWTKKDLSYLVRDNYDTTFIKTVYGANPINLNNLEAAARENPDQALRITYTDQKSFKAIAKKLDIMNDSKDNYDPTFIKTVYGSNPINPKDVEAAARENPDQAVRITYTDQKSFKVLAKALDIMNDSKEGVPRTAYRGVIPMVYKGLRLYLTPTSNWNGYDKTWK